MEKQLRCVVVFFHGTEPPKNIVERFVRDIDAFAGTPLGVTSLSEDDLAKVVAVSTEFEKPKVDPFEKNPQEKAIIYIGGRYRQYLYEGDYSSFMQELMKDLMKSIGKSDLHSKALVNAVNTIASGNGVLASKELMVKNYFNEDVINIIVDLSKLTKRFA